MCCVYVVKTSLPVVCTSFKFSYEEKDGDARDDEEAVVEVERGGGNVVSGKQAAQSKSI